MAVRTSCRLFSFPPPCTAILPLQLQTVPRCMHKGSVRIAHSYYDCIGATHFYAVLGNWCSSGKCIVRFHQGRRDAFEAVRDPRRVFEVSQASRPCVHVVRYAADETSGISVRIAMWRPPSSKFSIHKEAVWDSHKATKLSSAYPDYKADRGLRMLSMAPDPRCGASKELSEWASVLCERQSRRVGHEAGELKRSACRANQSERPTRVPGPD